MKRATALLGLAVVVAAGVLLVQRANSEREYLRLLKTGEEALGAGNSYGATEAFTGALTLRPQSMVAYFHRGEAYRAQRRDDEALRDLHEAVRLAPDAPQPLVALGDLYDAGGDPGRAAIWYGQAADRLKGQDSILLYKLALALYRAAKPADAIAPLRDAIAHNDSAGEVHYLLGLIYRDIQRTDDAVASLERAVKVAPTLLAAREELADLYRSQGRLVAEMGQLQALASLDDQTDRIVAIGLAQARRGQFPSALGTLAQAASRAQNDSHVQLAVGRVYLARAEKTSDPTSVAGALEALETALGGTARRSEGLALFGRALYLAADYTGAERILREATATSPVLPEAFGYLADASERLGHFSEAREALMTFDVLQGDTASAETRIERVQRLGALSLRANDVPGALVYLNEAVAAGRKDARTFGLLAQARWQAGDLDRAQEALSAGLALEPRNADLLRLRRTMR
jgi:tetratricopeptide (TPR) repeat protein